MDPITKSTLRSELMASGAWWLMAIDDGNELGGAGGSGTEAPMPAGDPPAAPSGVGTEEAGSETSDSDPPTQDAESTAAEPSVPTPPPTTDWRERRIARLTAQKRELEEKLRSFAGQGAETPPPEDGRAIPTDAEIERRVVERAAAMAAQQAFNQRCNDTAAAGRKAFGEAEFNSAVNGLQQLVDRDDPGSASAFTAFLEAAMETGEGARLVYELGRDPNEAARIMALAPTRMGVELGKRVAGRTPGPAPTSAAPKPITPVQGRGGTREAIDPDDTERADRLTTAAWMERRNAQIAARGSR